MTSKCIETLKRLRSNEDFTSLSVEALLYEAIRSTDEQDVRFTLESLISDMASNPKWLEDGQG